MTTGRINQISVVPQWETTDRRRDRSSAFFAVGRGAYPARCQPFGHAPRPGARPRPLSSARYPRAPLAPRAFRTSQAVVSQLRTRPTRSFSLAQRPWPTALPEPRHATDALGHAIDLVAIYLREGGLRADLSFRSRTNHTSTSPTCIAPP